MYKSVIFIIFTIIVYVTSFQYKLYQSYRYRKYNVIKNQLNNDIEWSTNNIPNSYNDVMIDLTSELNQYIQSNNDIKGLHSIDLLIPGLNPKLEQKAMLLQEILFQLVVLILQTIQLKYNKIIIMFTSIGDAASYMKYCRKYGIVINDSTEITGLNSNYELPNDINTCLLFIALKNNVGDPIIVDIQNIVNNNPNIFSIVINCDLNDKMNAGMKIKTQRDLFRSTIKPIYYFRNIVEITRPSLVPNEIGILIYKNKQWNIYIANPEDIHGSGSLNRFMLKENAVFKRDVKDPTSINPPRYLFIQSYNNQPKRDEIDSALSKADYIIRKANENNKIVKPPVTINTIDQAIDIINNYYIKKDNTIDDILKAIDFHNNFYNNQNIIKSDDNVISESTISSDNNNRLGMLDISIDSPTIQSYDNTSNNKDTKGININIIFELSWNIFEQIEIINNKYRPIEPKVIFATENWKFIDRLKLLNIEITIGPIRVSDSKKSFSISNDSNKYKLVLDGFAYNIIYLTKSHLILKSDNYLILLSKR